MKFLRITAAWIVVGSCSFLLAESGLKSLAEIYRGGRIELIPELTLTDESLPEDVYFQAPSFLTFDREDRIYIVDYENHTIFIFDAQGQYLKNLGREGQGPGEFEMPFYAACGKDRLAVWDLGRRSLIVLDLEGNHLKSIRFSPREGWPNNIRALPNGDFIVERTRTAWGDNEKPQVCLLEIYSPDLILKKTVLTQEFWENRYITDPRPINIPQPFHNRIYWDVDLEGKIIAGFSEKYELNFYDLRGERTGGFSYDYKPIKITDKDKEQFFSGITYNAPDGTIKHGAPDFTVKNTRFPKYKPAFQHILADGEGNILVFGFSREPGHKTHEFCAFTNQGKFISRVFVKGDSLPENLFRTYFHRRNPWIRAATEDGIFQFVKYRIEEAN